MVLPADLEFAAHYSYETKKGDKLMGSTFGLNGGDPRSVIIPERIDYHTQQIDGALRYGGEHLQLALEYFGSAFDDDENSQTWQNPYTADPAWSPSAGFQGPPVGQIAACVGVPECGTGQRSQPPDNWFNQIVASGGYDLPYRTRVTLRTAFGWSTQNEDFLPYTINPILTAVPAPDADSPRCPETPSTARSSRRSWTSGSPRGRWRSSGSTPATGSSAATTTRRSDLYIYIPNDSADQGTVDDDTARINLPYSLTRHEVTFDAGYALPLRSELALGYEWELTERDYQEVRELQANTLSAMLTSRPTSYLNTRLNYEHTWRNGSELQRLESLHRGPFARATSRTSSPPSRCRPRAARWRA